MADNVMTEASTITCPHAGAVTLAGAGKPALKSGGNNALVPLSLMGKPVTGCTYISVTLTAPLPCVSVTLVSGPSTVLQNTGEYVVLASSTVQVTNPELGPLPCTLTPNQSALKG